MLYECKYPLNRGTVHRNARSIWRRSICAWMPTGAATRKHIVASDFSDLPMNEVRFGSKVDLCPCMSAVSVACPRILIAYRLIAIEVPHLGAFEDIPKLARALLTLKKPFGVSMFASRRVLAVLVLLTLPWGRSGASLYASGPQGLTDLSYQLTPVLVDRRLKALHVRMNFALPPSGVVKIKPPQGIGQNEPSGKVAIEAVLFGRVALTREKLWLVHANPGQHHVEIDYRVYPATDADSVSGAGYKDVLMGNDWFQALGENLFAAPMALYGPSCNVSMARSARLELRFTVGRPGKGRPSDSPESAADNGRSRYKRPASIPLNSRWHADDSRCGVLAPSIG